MTSTSYAESIPSLTSKNSKYSVYQTDGKPLSTEAIYRAKMKYGVYNNPAKVSLGVDPSASDTAAILAANTDLSIHAYHKDLSAEAAHAALIANPDEIVGWKRTNIAPEAEYAALYAKGLKMPFDNSDSKSVNSFYNEADAAGAATAVLNKNSKNLARSQLQDIYDFDDVRSGKVTLSQFSDLKNNKSLKSLTTKKDYRSGVSSSSLGADTNRTMNIGNITDAATKAAKAQIEKRVTPIQDNRGGLKTSSKAVNSNRDTSIYIQNIHSQAIAASKKELNKTTIRRNGLQTASDKGLVANPAEYAAASLKLDPARESFKSTIQNNDLVTQNIYAVAAEKTKKNLQKINDDIASRTALTNIKATEQAYKIAQANAEKRRLTEPGPGKIALGGGLTMKYNEIEKLATSLVQPAIVDMESRIVEMKAHDDERKLLPGKIKQREIEFKEEKRQEQLALERKRAEEAQARREQLDLDKQALDEEHENHKVHLAGLLTTRKEEFTQQTEEEEAKKTEIDEEREEKLRVLTEAKEAKDKERQEELDLLQSERDEKIAPLLAEHETETSKLKELTDDRVEKENIFNDIDSKVKSTQADLDDTLSKIETMNQRLAELEASVSEVSAKEATVVAAATASVSLLHGEGKQKEAELESFATERKNLESKRVELHEENTSKVEELKKAGLEYHENEKEVNAEFPEHLRKEVAAPEDLDDSDLSDSKFKLDDSTIEIPPEIEEEPEFEKEEVWPKVEEPEVEEPEVEEPEVKEPDVEEPDVNESAAKEQTTKKSVVLEGSDPLANVPTQDKPPMVNVAPKEVKKLTFAQRTAKKLASGPTPKSANNPKPAPYGISATPNGQNKEKKGLFGLFKSKSKSKPNPVPATPVKEPTKSTAKTTTTAPVSKEPVETEIKAEKVEKKTDNVDDDVFSGFSQGSEVDA